MTLDELSRGAASGLEPAESYSVAWWESRSPEDLRDIINRGFAGGALFKAANAEIERRAREETRRLRDLAAAEESVRRRRQKLVLVILSVFVLAAIVWFAVTG